ncbi:MAG: HAD-IA family hydrolase [Chloroflexi bacterium]|nr:HAD-IA family hydrolase [Chloroflexota bacterium]MBL6960917.1 HAD-IA family hydrolase [Anaerolineales bacterium]
MAKIKAVFFDQDGVIIDTERDGHRVAFNQTFKDFGYDFEWDVAYYHELLQVAGGKERMKHHLHTKGFGVEINPEEVDDLIKKMHKHKTAVFVELIESGKLPLRPGVKRLMQEVNNAGLLLGICTTSNERAAQAVVNGMLGEIKFKFVLAGDIVEKKKPDPEIYNLALSKSGFKPEECIVIEDSRNGVLAAHAAGLNIVATTNIYTASENLSDANIITTCLGDADGEKGKLNQGGEGIAYDGVLHLEQLMEYFSK